MEEDRELRLTISEIRNNYDLKLKHLEERNKSIGNSVTENKYETKAAVRNLDDLKAKDRKVLKKRDFPEQQPQLVDDF